MPYAKLLNAEIIGSTVQPANTVLKLEQGVINALGANAFQIDRSSLADAEPAAWALCAKGWAAYVPLGSSGTQIVDLTALSVSGTASSSSVGDTVLANCFVVEIHNREAIGSGHNLIVGNEGSANEFSAFISSTAHETIVIPPNTRRVFTIKDTGGWTTTSLSKIKLASGGAYACECDIALGGN